MEFNVAQLLKQHVGAIREYDLDDEFPTDDNSELVNVGHIVGHVKFLRTDQGVLVQGNLHTSVESNCSRCLTTCRVPVEFHLEEEFFPSIDVLTGLPVPAPEDEFAFSIDANHILDMREAIRQYLIIALPMQPVCRDDCLGLCPECGQNLNEGQCSCAVPDVDPRLASLGEILREQDKA